MTTIDFPLKTESDLSRLQFEGWVKTVRDPARAADEGKRQIEVENGSATASYHIAPLPDGNWAVQIDCRYACGDLRGVSTPWMPLPTRQACLDFFLQRAREHFGGTLYGDSSDLQRECQQLMLQKLRGGLFGFLEPDVIPPDSQSQ